MSILDRFRNRSHDIPANATFRLTQSGQDKIANFEGDTKSRVLVALETRGTSDIDEIAGTSGLSRGVVERLIPQLVRGGLVQYVSGADMGAE